MIRPIRIARWPWRPWPNHRCSNRRRPPALFPPPHRAQPPAATRIMPLPFFYGWLVVAIAFVTMGIGVNARTAFSLLFPPILGEFGWERGVIAGAFSFGFLVSAVLSPMLGRMMDRFGPVAVMELGVGLMA